MKGGRSDPAALFSFQEQGKRGQASASMPTRRSFLSQALWLAAGAGAFWLVRDKILWSEPQPAFAPGGSSGWLDFAVPRQPLPTLKASVGGREVTALLDSGAQYSVIDKSLADELGLEPTFAPLVAVGVGGHSQLGRGVSLDVQAGKLSLRRLKAAVLDLGPIVSEKGLGAPLILGQDVLGQVIADIDFPRRRLMLAAPGVHALPEGAKAAPVTARGKALQASVTVLGSPMEAVIDTGASIVLAVTKELAQETGLLTGRAVRRGTSVVLGGAMTGQIITLERMDFAGAIFTDIDVLLYPQQRIPGFPKALLGVGALRRFRAVLNHSGGAMHLVRRGRP
jgi:predicted aspartyl protease